MGLEKLFPWGKKKQESQERVEPTLDGVPAQEQAQPAFDAGDPPGIQVRNIGESAQAPTGGAEEDPNVAAALASIQEQDAGAPAVPPSQTMAPTSMTVGPDFKRGGMMSRAEKPPAPTPETVAPPNVIPPELPRIDLNSPKAQEATHLQANRPLAGTQTPSLQERLLSSTALPQEVEPVAQTAELKQDLDALIAKAESAKTPTEQPTGEIISTPGVALEDTLNTYMYAGGRLPESAKAELRTMHAEALASEDPHDKALELYQKKFKNAYDKDLQEAFLTSVALDKDAPQLEAVDALEPDSVRSAENDRVRPDGKIEPTLDIPNQAAVAESRDMGDGRIEPTLGDSPQLRVVEGSAPQPTTAREAGEQPSVPTSDEPALKTAALGAAVVTKREKEQAEGKEEAYKEGTISYIDTNYLQLKKEGRLEEAERVKKKGHGKIMTGAAQESVTNAQLRDFEALKAAQGEQPSATETTGSGNTPEQSPTSDETPSAAGAQEAGNELPFMSGLEMFTFSEGFTERVDSLLEKATQEVDKDEVMDILDSLADALLKDNDAKFDRQKDKLRTLCGDIKTEDGRSLLDALLFALQKEMLRNAVEQTQARQAREAPPAVPPQTESQPRAPEGAEPRYTLDQIAGAISKAYERGYENATEAARELTELSVEKAEARGVGRTLRAIIGGAAAGAISIGGAAAAAPTLGVAIGGLTIGTAAVAGGGLGIAVAGAAMAIGILTKQKNKKNDDTTDANRDQVV